MTLRNKIFVIVFATLEFIAVLFFLELVAARAAGTQPQCHGEGNRHGARAACYESRLL